MTTNTTTAPVGRVTSMFTRLSTWPTIVSAIVILTVVMLCAVIVLYRRVKLYRGSLDQVHAKIDTLIRLTENDEKLVDEPLPVEVSQPQKMVDTEVQDAPTAYQTTISDSEDEDEEEEQDEDDIPHVEDYIPRVEELPPPVPIPTTTKKPRRKSSSKAKATVMDLDAVVAP